MAYGDGYRKEHLPFSGSQNYTIQVRKDGPTGAWVLVGERAKYQALKAAIRKGISL
jgi:hypothetical protein